MGTQGALDGELLLLPLVGAFVRGVGAVFEAMRFVAAVYWDGVGGWVGGSMGVGFMVRTTHTGHARRVMGAKEGQGHAASGTPGDEGIRGQTHKTHAWLGWAGAYQYTGNQSGKGGLMDSPQMKGRKSRRLQLPTAQCAPRSWNSIYYIVCPVWCGGEK